MTSVSALPFAVGIAGSLLLFAAWLPLAIRESRRPYRWRVPAAPVLHHELPASPRLAVMPSRDERVAAPEAKLPERRTAPSRVALVAAAFTVWSLWSLRPRSAHH